MGRNTKGVKGISLRDNDEVVGMVVVDPEGFLMTVCENGFGKRTPFGSNQASEEDEEIPQEGEEPIEEPVSEESEIPEGEEVKDRSTMRYRRQHRGGKGVRDIQTSGYAPSDGRESAIIADLPPGNYTAIVRGFNDTVGVALVEVYDLSPSPSPSPTPTPTSTP
jgi:hypothetical protein